jgi:hypothetical protein
MDGPQLNWGWLRWVQGLSAIESYCTCNDDRRHGSHIKKPRCRMTLPKQILLLQRLGRGLNVELICRSSSGSNRSRRSIAWHVTRNNDGNLVNGYWNAPESCYHIVHIEVTFQWSKNQTGCPPQTTCYLPKRNEFCFDKLVPLINNCNI